MPPPTTFLPVTIAPQGGVSTPLSMLNVAYQTVAPENIASGIAYADAQQVDNQTNATLGTGMQSVWGIYNDGGFPYPYVGSSYGTYPMQTNAVAGSFANPIGLTNNGYTISSDYSVPTITLPNTTLNKVNAPYLVQGYVYAGSYVSVASFPNPIKQARIYRGWINPVPAAPVLTATVNCTTSTVTLTWTDPVVIGVAPLPYVHIWRNGVKIARQGFSPKSYVDTTAPLTSPVSYQVSYFYGTVDGNGNEIGVYSSVSQTLFWDGIGPQSNPQTVACGPTPCACCNWTQDSGPPQMAWTADSGPSACAWQIVKPCDC